MVSRASSRVISRPENAKRRLALGDQLALISALYDEMLAHYGVDIGLRHARKHLGWALDTAAATAGAPLHLLKAPSQPRADRHRPGDRAAPPQRGVRRIRRIQRARSRSAA